MVGTGGDGGMKENKVAFCKPCHLMISSPQSPEDAFFYDELMGYNTAQLVSDGVGARAVSTIAQLSTMRGDNAPQPDETNV